MLQCFVKPKPNQKWVKKGATGQSFIRKEITTYRIATLAPFLWEAVECWAQLNLLFWKNKYVYHKFPIWEFQNYFQTIFYLHISTRQNHFIMSISMWDTLHVRWISVGEFHDWALWIGKVFGQELTVVKWNYQILGLHQVMVHQKLGVILIIKWFKNWSQQKMLFYKKGAPKLIFFNEFFC